MEVVGIYITEDRVDCVIGELDKQLSPSIGIRRPITKNRTYQSFVREKKRPSEFLQECAEWIAENTKNLISIVVGCFGTFKSLDNSNVNKTDYDVYGVLGEIQQYPHWSRVHVYHIFQGVLAKKYQGIQVRVFTDVDVAAYGEYWYRAGKGPNVPRGLKETSLVFLSFSRTINGGVAYDGQIWKGRLHPSMGSIRPARLAFENEQERRLVDSFEGCCPNHKDCYEGLIGVSALEARTNTSFDMIAADDPVWEYVAYYVACLCTTVTAVLAPSKIVLGGRVIKEQTDMEFASNLLRRTRGYFYDLMREPRGDSFSLSYQELSEKDQFISLPIRPKNKAGEDRMSMPGRHGALRMAAANAYDILGINGK